MRRINKTFIWIVVVAIVIIVASAFVMKYLNGTAPNAALVDSKIALLQIKYPTLEEDDIIQKEGGYNEETGMYEYRFVWYYTFKDVAVLKYEGAEDLTRATIDQIYAVRLAEEDKDTH